MVNNRFLMLVKRTNGRIVNVASYLSRFSPPNNSQYAMSKYALRSYSDSLRYCFCSFNDWKCIDIFKYSEYCFLNQSGCL